MTKFKEPEVSGPSFIESRPQIKLLPETEGHSTNGGISRLYREILSLRAQLDEAEGRLNEKLAKAPCTRAF